MTNVNHTVPFEGARHFGLWVGWPHLRGEWGESFEAARAEIAVFIEAAAQFVPVRVACGSAEALQSAGVALQNVAGVRCFSVPAGDIWVRDTGPIFATGDEDAIALTFRFNGWGGKYVMPGDSETATALAAVENIDTRAHDFVLEGGAIELDGAGRLLTTRECLLNSNRNPGWSEPEAERALKAALNVREIIWLDGGLAHDHTDGHVDNIARFVSPGHVVCQSASGSDDPNAARYFHIQQELQKAGLEVSVLPSPGRIEDAAGLCLPASHLNYLLTNGAVLLPTYEPTFSVSASAALKALFPDRTIIPLPASSILTGGGSFHCMTREVPQLTAKKDA